MPHVTDAGSTPDRPVYQVGGKSFIFFRTPRPDAVDPDDLETLQDLVVAAVRDARHAVDQLAAETMGPLAGGLGGGGGLGLPGL